MSDSWKEDDCTAIIALYSVYSVPQAAALWCGVNEKELQQVLSEVTQLSDSGKGRGIWQHPKIKCIEPRSRAIADGIDKGLLLHGRESGQPVSANDHVAYERRHITGKDLKSWMQKTLPNEKPAFLFDELEQDSHTSISSESYRALKIDRDGLKIRLENSIIEFEALRKEVVFIKTERDSLNEQISKFTPSENKTDKASLSKSSYWGRLSKLSKQAIVEYPAWKDKQRKVQKSGNLQDWLTQEIKADSREAEIIKKILSNFYQELR